MLNQLIVLPIKLISTSNGVSFCHQITLFSSFFFVLDGFLSWSFFFHMIKFDGPESCFVVVL